MKTLNEIWSFIVDNWFIISPVVYEILVRLIPTSKNWSMIDLIFPNRKKLPLLLLLALASLSSFAQTELQLPYSIRVLNPKPLDAYYFNLAGVSYTDVTQVTTQVTSGVRFLGQTFNVQGIEYWFADGITDGDLVIKISSGAYWPLTGSAVMTDNVSINGAVNKIFNLNTTDGVNSSTIDVEPTLVELLAGTSNVSVNQTTVSTNSPDLNIVQDGVNTDFHISSNNSGTIITSIGTNNGITIQSENQATTDQAIISLSSTDLQITKSDGFTTTNTNYSNTGGYQTISVGTNAEVDLNANNNTFGQDAVIQVLPAQITEQAETILLKDTLNTTGVQIVTGGLSIFSTGSHSMGVNGSGVSFSLGSTNATGDIFYRNSSGYVTRLPIGAAQSSLTVSSGIPSWSSISNTTGTTNFFAGINAGNLTVSGLRNTGIGYAALNGITTGNNNSTLGYRSGTALTTGSFNVMLGDDTGLIFNAGVSNTFIGTGAGISANNCSNNTTVGSTSGSSITTGNRNILIGDASGNAITTGSQNVTLGYNSQVPVATNDNQLSIQNIIYGLNNNSTGTTVSTGFLGIGQKTPTAELHMTATTANKEILLIEEDGGADAIHIKEVSGVIQILMPNLPTSATGLPTGCLWNNAGILSVAP